MWKELPWNQKVLTLFPNYLLCFQKIVQRLLTLLHFLSVKAERKNAYLISNLDIEKSVINLQTYQVSCTKMRFPQLLPNTHSHSDSPPYLCWAVPQLPFSSHLSVTIPGSLQPLVPALFPHICSEAPVLCHLWAGGHTTVRLRGLLFVELQI